MSRKREREGFDEDMTNFSGKIAVAVLELSHKGERCGVVGTTVQNGCNGVGLGDRSYDSERDCSLVERGAEESIVQDFWRQARVRVDPVVSIEHNDSGVCSQVLGL